MCAATAISGYMYFLVVCVCVCVFTLAGLLYVGVCDIYACACLLQWARIFKMDLKAKLYNDFWENNKLRFQIKAIMEMRLWSN